MATFSPERMYNQIGESNHLQYKNLSQRNITFATFVPYTKKYKPIRMTNHFCEPAVRKPLQAVFGFFIVEQDKNVTNI